MPRFHFIKRFAASEGGALTSFGLFLIIAMICVGGMAVDVGNAVMVRTHLQVAADSAAHAAIMAREFKSEAQAKAMAVDVARVSLPHAAFGDTIKPDDIQFGKWDEANDRFIVIPGSREAVLVNTQRLQARQNGVGTYFLRFVNLWNIDVVRQSVFTTYYPTCFREGFVGQSRVDVQSNNHYRAGFCIHSNDHVEVNNNNVFEDGVIVSMPFETDIVMPASGFGGNPGLADALRSGSYRLRILQRVADITAGYMDSTSKYFRSDYLSLPVQTENLSAKQNLDNSVWKAGRIHKFTCTGGASNGGGNGNGGGGGNANTVKIPANTKLVRGVIDTNCLIDIGAGVILQDVLIISTNTDIGAVSGASGVVLGRDDGCVAGGGVQIVTKGGVHFPSQLHIYGSQIVAEKKIDFEANANGIEGVSMVSGGEIDSTSNMDMGFCNGSGLENRFEAEYFRMVR